jgi:cell division protein FtsQ
MIKIILKSIFQILIVVSFLAFISVGLIYQYDPQMLPITTVQIIAPLRFVTENEIKDTVINTDIANKGFFNINMEKIKQHLSVNPWLYDINLTRVWPDKLRITFNEDRPLAYLNNQGIITQRDCKFLELNNSLNDALERNGYNYSKKLPILVGDKKKYQKLCDTLEKLKISVKPIDVSIKKLVISQRNSIYIELENGLIVLLGKQDIDKRVNRFVNSYSKLMEDYLSNSRDKAMSFLYIDMRYHDGLAVGNRTEQNIIELMETA